MSAEQRLAKVLLVENNPSDVDLIQERVEEERYRPVSLNVCTSLAEAIETARATSPEIILLDLGLPDSTGIRTFEQMHTAVPNIPVIVLTGQDDSDLGARCIEMGAADYLIKGRVESFIVAAIYNTVARAKTQVALVKSQESLKRILSDSRDAILVLDSHNVIKFANRAATELFGGRVVPGQDVGLPLANKQSLELDVPKSDGTTTTVEMLVGESEWHGAPAKVVSFRDVTERKYLQTQIAQSDRLASMGMLAAGVAHEVNNPLTYILYNLESLSKDFPEHSDSLRACRHLLGRHLGEDRLTPLLGEHARAFDQTILEDMGSRFRDALEGTTRVKEVVRGLSTFSRVQEDRIVPVDVRHVIEVAINMVFNEIKYRARIVKNYSPVPPIMASDGRLSQVFVNLLVNAAHAIPEGNAEHHEIRIRTWQEGEEVRVEVRDTGKGIAPQELGHIFDPFFTTKPVGVGTGLGLSICNNIVTSYNGRITVSSEIGRGTSFVVHLPVQELKASDKLPADVPKPAQDSGVRGRILVIDDEVPIRKILFRILSNDHEIVQAESGQEAKEILEKDTDFDVILCDLMMPEVSGIDLHTWLCETTPLLSDRVVFITGGTFTPKAIDYLKRVPNIRIEKPFGFSSLRKMIGELVIAARSKT